MESKKIKNSGLPKSEVQNHSVSSHAILTIPKSQEILSPAASLCSFEKKMCPHSLHPQPDSPASEMSELWLNAVGPVLTPQPGRSENSKSEKLVASPVGEAKHPPAATKQRSRQLASSHAAGPLLFSDQRKKRSRARCSRPQTPPHPPLVRPFPRAAIRRAQHLGLPETLSALPAQRASPFSRASTAGWKQLLYPNFRGKIGPTYGNAPGN